MFFRESIHAALHGSTHWRLGWSFDGSRPTMVALVCANVACGQAMTELRRGERTEAVTPTHEFVDHVSELTLRVRAASFAELTAEAGRALAELLKRGSEVTMAQGMRTFELEASDRGALLVEFLNDLIFRAETERWVPTQIDAGLIGDRTLRVVAQGCIVDPAPTLVKAATFHALSVRDVDFGVEAEVTLDV